jgi:hypothetical protein
MPMPSPWSPPPCSPCHSPPLSLSPCQIGRLHHPDTAGTSPGQGEAGKPQNMTCPATPGRARACMDTSLDTLVHALAPSRPTSSHPLLSHTHSPRCQVASRHDHSRRRALSPSSASGLQGHDDADDATIHHFQRHDARRARHDTVNRAASMPCPFTAPTAVAMLDLTHAPRTSSPL